MTSNQKPRIPLKSGDEFDAFTAWRKYLNWGKGELRRIKNRYNRRLRRTAKGDIEDYGDKD